MAYQAVFKRYELKYMLTTAQKEALLQVMEPYMALDQYGRTTIRNIYFDTENYRLIRRSIEKPMYKEKLRIRSYRKTEKKDKVFVELKKKYDGVVYKRRVSMPQQAAMDWICNGVDAPDSQIGREVEYFRNFYQGLRPAVYLSYEREAFFCNDGSDFRVTFDDHIYARQDRLSLLEEPGGKALLPEGMVLMEVKTSGAIPLWMTKYLTENRIFKTSFSKYGTAYQTMIFGKGAYIHA